MEGRWRRSSPGEGRQRQEAEQELQAVETEQHGAQEELQEQDEGLQQQEVKGQSCTGQQQEERHS